MVNMVDSLVERTLWGVGGCGDDPPRRVNRKPAWAMRHGAALEA